jgi:hypothetical protein
MRRYWYQNNFLWIDIILILLLTIGFYMLCNPEGIIYDRLKDIPRFGDLLKPLKTGIPTEFYEVLAATSGVLLGFVFAAVPVLVGLSSDRKLTILKETSLGVQIHRLYFKTTMALGLATLSALIGVFTSQDTLFWVVALNFGIFGFAGSRVIHCLTIMKKLVEIIEKPSAEEIYAKMDEPW